MMFGNRAKNAPTSFLPDATSGGDYAPVQAPPADPKSGGFFGEGGTGRAIAGYVGDYLAQLGGARPIYAPIAQQRQLIQQQQVKRQNDWEDWVRQAQWERDNPKPVNNDTINDYNFISQQLGPDAGKAYLQKLSDPDVTVPLANGQVYVGPRSGMAAALQGPSKPVGKLTPIPEGGPMQPASGGFPGTR